VSKVNYKPVTAEEITLILGIKDVYPNERKAIQIAEDMLAGDPPFTRRELKRIAMVKQVTEEELTEVDERFAIYGDPVVKERKTIAERMLKRDFSVEMAAEISGLDLETVKRLKGR
jgi:hypothetical protein